MAEDDNKRSHLDYKELVEPLAYLHMQHEGGFQYEEADAALSQCSKK